MSSYRIDYRGYNIELTPILDYVFCKVSGSNNFFWSNQYNHLGNKVIDLVKKKIDSIINKVE